jgi:MFS family permease
MRPRMPSDSDPRSSLGFRPDAGASDPDRPEACIPFPDVRHVRLHGWRHPAVLSAAILAIASGFAQFGVTAALADVARAFGAARQGPSLAEEIGLSLTTLGVGLGVIRFAALGGMPLAALADRVGRRRMILGCCLVGLALTVVAAGSPTFWWFVVMIALGRPLLSATNTLAGVIAAEQTRAADRAKAVALIAAAYAIGAGLVAVIRGISGLGFRQLFVLATVPLVVVAVIGRRLEEPERYTLLRQLGTETLSRPSFGRVPGRLRGRLALLAGLWFAFAFVIGPGNTLVFLYAESILGMARSTTAVLVLAAGPLGLTGLLLGRWAADRFGRVPTAVVAHFGVALAGAVTYSLGMAGVIGGYLASLFMQSLYGPAVGALSAELFPTSVRGTASGWLHAAGVLGAVCGLVTFGLLADTFGSFGPAALVITIPMALGSASYLLLPETRGLELEESAPER